MKKFFHFLFFSVITVSAMAQGAYAPLNADYYHWVDRYEIKQGVLSNQFFTSWKPYKRSAIAGFVDSLGGAESSADQFNKMYLANDNWEWSSTADNNSEKPLLNRFYRVKSDLYYVRTDGLDLHLNPVIMLGAGQESANDINTFVNTRGAEVRGSIDDKVGFYSFIAENQVIFPDYVRSRIRDSRRLYVPNEGFWKGFKEDGVDFFTARGYLTFHATQHIDLQFGHDRFKIGNGYRSMILSDYAPAYLFLKLNTQVWKIKYTNLFTRMTAGISGNASGLTGGGNQAYPHKYLSLHHLSVNLGKKVNVGLFESVVYSRPDSVGNSLQAEYLNPIIFYRAIEQQNGSPDNALVGMDIKWLVAKKLSIYGQLVLDEFVLDNIKRGDGWWANKFGVQVGGEYIDALGIDNLDLQGEINLARPYTYSHNAPSNSYSHYHQPLAHPLGANFKEVVAIARYQPFGKLNLSAKIIYASYGADSTGVNYGGNILLDNATREQDRGNEIGQGINNQLLFADFTASYQWKHNVFVDVKYIHRQVESEVESYNESTSYVSATLRWNIPQRLNEF